MMSSKTTILTFTILVLLGVAACGRGKAESNASTPLTSGPSRNESADAELAKTIRLLSGAVAGDISVAVVHVESGRLVEVEGAKKLPLYSVYKLPLVVTVLREVEAGRVKLETKVQVTPADVASGSQYNRDLWRKPQEVTVAQLIEFAIVRSDNTSADKLLALVGGPSVVTQQVRALGFSNIDIVVSSGEFAANRNKPNTGASTDFARLLTQLQKGDILQPANVSSLLDQMERSRTGGERRLRANLPPGTRVADKTGSGDTVTNDVGLITLPENKGHLAIAVLISSSKLPTDKQEKTIAEIARAAYDSFVSQPVTR
jgi:beta-lactamase class A